MLVGMAANSECLNRFAYEEEAIDVLVNLLLLTLPFVSSTFSSSES